MIRIEIYSGRFISFSFFTIASDCVRVQMAFCKKYTNCFVFVDQWKAFKWNWERTKMVETSERPKCDAWSYKWPVNVSFILKQAHKSNWVFCTQNEDFEKKFSKTKRGTIFEQNERKMAFDCILIHFHWKKSRENKRKNFDAPKLRHACVIESCMQRAMRTTEQDEQKSHRRKRNEVKRKQKKSWTKWRRMWRKTK